MVCFYAYVHIATNVNVNVKTLHRLKILFYRLFSNVGLVLPVLLVVFVKYYSSIFKNDTIYKHKIINTNVHMSTHKLDKGRDGLNFNL